jgi:uridylate kinase
MKYRRILLKLSGESLLPADGYGIDALALNDLAAQITGIKELGVEMAIVIGGGNIFRGARGEGEGISRVTGDYMGMIATLINSLALQDALEKREVPVRVQSALPISSVVEPFVRRKALKHLEKGRIVLFACGTGNPFFTTDTAAAVRAREINAEVLLKATKVDGVFDKDPIIFKDARLFREISFNDALVRDLRVMDATALTLCRESKIPIVVFNVRQNENLKKVVLGEDVGTIIRRET